MTVAEVRRYSAQARSTDTFGRVLCNARDHHFVIDGPVWNGCPGEALTPGEAFLAAIAACGVELAQVIAAQRGIELGAVDVSIDAVVDREHPVRADMTVFNRVTIRFAIGGVSEQQATDLAEEVGRRCPLYGSVAASAAQFEVEVNAA